MLNAFTRQLNEHGFTLSEIDQITSSAQLIELPTRHILLHQGQVAEEIYFLLNGICHSAYLTDKGKEYSKEFYWENDWIIGFESLISQQASPYLLESLTECTLVVLPVETLRDWRKSRNSLYMKLLETQLLYKENKERFMLLYSPEERYDLFCQSFPQLLNRLNDYQIAAYLGITPISLSRIKNRGQS
jgi:CRP-like cAMP-binding protein